MIDIHLLLCPDCHGDVVVGGSGFRCTACGKKYSLEDGVLRCFVMHEKSGKDVTENMKAFYEENPFPNYEEIDTIDVLRQKARTGIFAKALDDQLPRGIDILECGCGTGQLTNFLAAGGRNVYGTDICINSLSLARTFKERNGIDRARFMQMNLFKPCFKEESFDLVVSNGVLHHTSDPRGGFESIARLVKPGGFVIIGLYHQYARLGTDFRRVLFHLTRGAFQSLDPQLRKIGSDAKRRAWYMDQYMNPHESKHTAYEVGKWCTEVGLTVVNTIPKTLIGDTITSDERLFRKTEMPGRFESFLTEFSQAFRRNDEGGLFMVIAKR